MANQILRKIFAASVASLLAPCPSYAEHYTGFSRVHDETVGDVIVSDASLSSGPAEPDPHLHGDSFMAYKADLPPDQTPKIEDAVAIVHPDPNPAGAGHGVADKSFDPKTYMHSKTADTNTNTPTDTQTQIANTINPDPDPQIVSFVNSIFAGANGGEDALRFAWANGSAPQGSGTESGGGNSSGQNSAAAGNDPKAGDDWVGVPGNTANDFARLFWIAAANVAAGSKAQEGQTPGANGGDPSGFGSTANPPPTSAGNDGQSPPAAANNPPPTSSGNQPSQTPEDMDKDAGRLQREANDARQDALDANRKGDEKAAQEAREKAEKLEKQARELNERAEESRRQAREERMAREAEEQARAQRERLAQEEQRQKYEQQQREAWQRMEQERTAREILTAAIRNDKGPKTDTGLGSGGTGRGRIDAENLADRIINKVADGVKGKVEDGIKDKAKDLIADALVDGGADALNDALGKASGLLGVGVDTIKELHGFGEVLNNLADQAQKQADAADVQFNQIASGKGDIPARPADAVYAQNLFSNAKEAINAGLKVIGLDTEQITLVDNAIGFLFNVSF